MLRLPAPLGGYDRRNEAETRRLIESEMGELATAVSNLDTSASSVGGSHARIVVPIAVPVVSANTDAVGSFALPTGVRAMLVDEVESVDVGIWAPTVSKTAGRLRCYRTATLRDAASEVARAFTTTPGIEGENLADWQLNPLNPTPFFIRCDPVPRLVNGDAVASNTIFYRWRNHMTDAAGASLILRGVAVEDV